MQHASDRMACCHDIMIDQEVRGLKQAVIRYRVLCGVEFLRERGLSLAQAMQKMSAGFLAGRQGGLYARRTIEDWWYSYSKVGFEALIPKRRCDRGLPRILSVEDCALLKRLTREKPGASAKQVWRELACSARHSAGAPSYETTIRYLRGIGFKPKAVKELNETKSEITLREEESWMLNVMQGQVSPVELTCELKGTLSREEIAGLNRCVTGGPLRYRNRALSLLSLKKGIRKTSINRFLRVGVNYVDSVEREYRKKGLSWVREDTRTGPRKYEQDLYKAAVFAILHSPPSTHGINRTTWRGKDIQRILFQQGLSISSGGIRQIIRKAGYKFYKARKVLTSNDPDYKAKLEAITNILQHLKPDEKFFSVDEFGPFAVKIQGGRSLMAPGELKTVPQHQRSKGSVILTAALELSENQVTHFYSEKKNTHEMLKLLEILLAKYTGQSCIYFSWDAASWHASKKLYNRVEEINSMAYRAAHQTPLVRLAPLPSCAQFLNVIESVFSGMAKAIIHNSNYQSVPECKAAIDRHFKDRNTDFMAHPKRAGKKIWGKEIVPPVFSEGNNCKDPRYRGGLH